MSTSDLATALASDSVPDWAPGSLSAPSAVQRTNSGPRAAVVAVGRPAPSPVTVGNARPRDVEGFLALAVAIGAVGAAGASLWPGLAVPAWPSLSLGVVALSVALGRGRPLVRGIAAFGGLCAALVGAVQIGVWWALAMAMP
jgi:hypothetical protein